MLIAENSYTSEVLSNENNALWNSRGQNKETIYSNETQATGRKWSISSKKEGY